MKNYMKEYIKKADELIESKKVDKELIEEHLIKIKFFAHERLVHFLVTMMVTIVFIILFLYSLTTFNIGFIILDLILIILLFFYYYHYYFLENSVQYMYKQYDKMLEIIKEKRK